MDDKHPVFTLYTPPAPGAKFAPLDPERFVKRAVPRIEEGIEHLDVAPAASPASLSTEASNDLVVEDIANTAEKLYDVLGKISKKEEKAENAPVNSID